MKNTKQIIIDAAIKVFNDDLSASLDCVAERADVHRRTLHLNFKSRQELIECCKNDMMVTCQQAMTDAYHASADPKKQLELMLYAGIDCGAKYAFLQKLYGKSSYAQVPEAEKNGTFDSIKHRWFKLIEQLQDQHLIHSQLSIAWIFTLFGGMITNTIDALQSGDVAPNDIKSFAWYSFSKSIGL
ncbi:TetR/AcrR family transcriptional regulator [Pedobacter psychrotolerans]|uniref:TetR/AcrR family transcriptional regulator n=1 Tax=Pedobacter psychrotolerans TaxID=1843235 RepID=UPI0014047F3A|nr:TetR/AcrR family transcriptional regulator [Pedobacter psychrotolerans]